MENKFIDAIEATKNSIESSKQRIDEYKKDDELAKPFLLKEEGYLKGLEQKLSALENLFFQYSQESFQSWIDDTQDYLNEFNSKESII